MKNVIYLVILGILLSSCASIPSETIELSTVMGSDIESLQKAQINLIRLHYQSIEDKLNNFIDNTYGPALIHGTLKSEYESYGRNEISIYSTLIEAGSGEADVNKSKLAVQEMSDLIQALNEQIENYRTELLNPIVSQRDSLIYITNEKYLDLISANATITGYLKSVKEVRKAQNVLTEKIGLVNVDSLFIETMVTTSDGVNSALKKTKEVNIKADEALDKIDKISNEIKNVLNEKK